MLGARIGLAQVQFETDSLTLQLDETGRVAHVVDRSNQTDYVAVGHETPLLMAYINGEVQSPQSATWHPDQQRLTLRLAGAEIEVATSNKTSHLTFEIVRAEPLEAIERVQWGVATKIHDHVGEVIGVVRNERFAIGLLGLNVKTLGGPADHPEGRDVSRGRAAMSTDWGSSLQAYSMDRSRPRHVDVWGGQFPRMPVLPIPGETVVGSKIAVFGSPADSALDRVGEIEIAERLPHPVYQGMWSRKNKELGRSYLIAPFSEETVDEMIAYAKRANFLSLYHPSPFQSWGHYEPSDRFFPNGEAGLKACAEKAKQAGLLLGVHTLTNFINTNDPFVTPVPDKRLAQTGSSVLVGQVALDSTTIEVASPEYFNNTRSNWLKTVMIGDELIRYSHVSESEPWQLLDCRRGAFGTKAASHETGTTVAKLMDHPYKVFLANHEMQQEIARRLAELFNRTGINHLDFDGHEGCHASGQGDFGIETFAKVFYDNVQHFVHNGTSNSQPFYWHINTCCNWGEPWYGGFRSSMADYRINNQAMLERNFMPKMLGWFQLTADTTLADVEWLLARSAGYNSGFALSTSREALAANPHTPLLLDTIRTWEALRMNNAFTESQQAAMRDTSREFHLAPSEDHSLVLHPYRVSPTYEYAFYQRQPGEPTYAEWEYTQPGSAQELQFSLEVKGESGAVQDLSFEFDNYLSFAVPATVEAGQTLLCDGSDTLRIYDTKGRQVKKVSLPKSPPKIPNGPHDVTFTCDFIGDPPPTVHVQFKAMEAGQPVQAK
ncbi:MAG: hypothetical protein KDA87_01895 [Planctomycetales bacterium]|nr:hypothetical protein [Planctomycetales bacterium]